jgi:hypothetical protein
MLILATWAECRALSAKARAFVKRRRHRTPLGQCHLAVESEIANPMPNPVPFEKHQISRPTSQPKIVRPPGLPVIHSEVATIVGGWVDLDCRGKLSHEHKRPLLGNIDVRLL